MSTSHENPARRHGPGQWSPDGFSPSERHWMFFGGFTWCCLALVSNSIILVSEVGPRAAVPFAAAALVTSGLCAVGAVRVGPTVLRRLRVVTASLTVATAAVVALNLWVAWGSPAVPNDTGYSLFWPAMQVVVTLWLAVGGPWASLGALAIGSATSYVMVTPTVDGLADEVSAAAPLVAWLLLGLGVAYTVRRVVRSRAIVALSHGRITGEQAERVRNLRRMHDTVLQTLEGVALLASSDALDAHERLRIVGRSAREEARRIRGAIDGGARQSLLDDLTTMVELTRSLGLPAELVTVGDLPERLDARVHDACQGAALEALTNARRHAHASRVVVTAVHGGGTLTIEVRDDGRGLELGEAAGGFGVSQSIVGRVTEAGGHTAIDSEPGRGTVVRLRFQLAPGPSAPQRRRSLPAWVLLPRPVPKHTPRPAGQAPDETAHRNVGADPRDAVRRPVRDAGLVTTGGGQR